MFLSIFWWSYNILHAIGTEQGPTKFSLKYITDNGGGLSPHPPGNDTSACCRMLIYDRWAYRMNMRWHEHFWPPKVSGGPLGGLKALKNQNNGSYNFKNIIL